MASSHPIRAYRESQGISAAELAKRLGVQRNTIWRWESGRQSIERKLWGRVHEETQIPIEKIAMIGNEAAA